MLINYLFLFTITYQQRLSASPKLTRAKTVTPHRGAERRKSHVANMDFSDAEIPVVTNYQNLARRNSLSPNIISQLNVPQVGVHRGGSFRQHDRRLSHSPGYSIGDQPTPIIPEPGTSFGKGFKPN